jgi:hypothetical protein
MNWLGIIASIAAPGGILVALIERTRRENNRDHAKNSALLHKIDTKIDKVGDRLNEHIDWHLDRTDGV